jgi:tRNA G18 (ribose-2'-O)-methylase SpoU
LPVGHEARPSIRLFVTDGSGLDAYRLVTDPAVLRAEGLFVAEGRLVVERLLEDGRFAVHSVLLTPAAQRGLAAALARRPDVAVHVLVPEALRELTGFHFHRGCLALARRVESTATLEQLAACSRVLAIEGVCDPDNIGGLFRTALALGVGGVMLDAASADPLYRKAVRTSMAATLRVPFLRVDAWRETLPSLRSAGMRIVALTPGSDTTALEDIDVAAADRLVIAVGSEGSGLAAATLAAADLRVRIPVDPRADSLNVVTAAAIALYALRVTC